MSSPGSVNETSMRQIEELIVCPECHEALTIENDVVRCPTADFTGYIRDGVVLLYEPSTSFFDNKFEIMRRGHNHAGEWNFCYAEQIRLLEKYLRPGMIV